MAVPVLSFEHVTGKGRRFHLEDISFEMMPGFIYGLIGKNGAGKTTLFQYIMNENARYEGRICVEGEDIIKKHAVIMNKVGLVSSDNSFFGGCTCRQNAKILGPFYDEFSMETFEAVMEELKVSPGKVYQKMSLGEKYKFQLAFAIAHNPCLYLLDEVTVGMDPVFRREFFDMMRQLIKDEKASVLLTSHILSEMEINTDYAGVLKEGRLIVFGESPLVVAEMNGKSDSRMEEQQDKGRVKIK